MYYLFYYSAQFVPLACVGIKVLMPEAHPPSLSPHSSTLSCSAIIQSGQYCACEQHMPVYTQSYTNALRVLCNLLIHQFSYAYTHRYTLTHTHIYSHIVQYSLAYLQRFPFVRILRTISFTFVRLTLVFFLFFWLIAFVFRFVFSLFSSLIFIFISFNKNELNLSCKDSYCMLCIYELIDNRFGTANFCMFLSGKVFQGTCILYIPIGVCIQIGRTLI